MTRNLPVRFGAIAVALIMYSPETGAQVITGRILEQGTDSPISDAIVAIGDTVFDTGTTVRSGRDGRYTLKLGIADSVVIRARRLGFEPFRSPLLHIAVGETLDYDIRLAAAPRRLPDVMIRAEQDRVRDLQYFGMSGRSIPATFFTSSQIDAISKNAANYVDVVRGLRSISLVVTPSCIQTVVGSCLSVYVDERLIAAGGDPEMFRTTQFLVDPNDIDHIVLIRPRDRVFGLEGSLLIYTRRFTARQRILLRRP